MSFLFRKGNSRPNEAPKIESTPPDTSVKDGHLAIVTTVEEIESPDGQDDATALQVLNETAFVRPTPVPTPDQSGTLLPSPVAKLVTATTGLGTFTVRTYARAFEWGLGLGRETTLKSLELTRAGIEGVLKASAKDVSARRDDESDLARTDTENVLAKSMSALHWGFTGATIATSAGFTITRMYVESLEQVALQGLGALNSIVGDTESSRAVSAIITLIKEELTRPGAEDGMVPGYWDLIIGCAGFIVLQRWGRRKTAVEFRGNGGEETIWDLVIDDKGFRADVVGTRRDGGHEITATNNLIAAQPDVNSLEEGGMPLDSGLDLTTSSSSIALPTHDQVHMTDEEIRDRILAQLPPGARATITSSTLTLKTVQVDVYSSEGASIEAPPGLTLVSQQSSTSCEDEYESHQRIIFRTSLRRNSSAEIDPVESFRMTGMSGMSYEHGEDDGIFMVDPRKRRKSFTNSSRGLGIDHVNTDPSVYQESNNSQGGPVANQKKIRKPVTLSISQSSNRQARTSSNRNDQDLPKSERAGVIKKALLSLNPSQALSNGSEGNSQVMTHGLRKDAGVSSSVGSLSPRNNSTQRNIKRIYPAPEGMEGVLYTGAAFSPTPQNASPTTYFTMHEKTRESTVSQTDSFSVHSSHSRSGSPESIRVRARADSNLTKTKSHTEISVYPNANINLEETGTPRHHPRTRSYVPNLYSMGTKHNGEAIILQPKIPMHRSMFDDHSMLAALATDGKVPGMFPDRHFVKSVRRFARFASASYGSNFLRVMGITNPDGPLSTSTEMIVENIHHEHSSFATHTGLPADTILLSGFCDPHGGPISVSRNQPTMTPLMHFVSIDHDSKAVVLTCRGTLGFEDILTDMTCDYDDFSWQGKTYQLHQGIHASAKRLVEGGGRRVMSTIQAALEEYADYGLILCGHSLGGAVAAVLALLISEPNKARASSHSNSNRDVNAEPSFVTATQQKLLTDSNVPTSSYVPPVILPAGRPIHVFAYGPPASFSPPLRLATRGLITTIINHNDVVPSLSLGTLQDFKAMAIHLKQDPSSPLVRVRSAMVERLKYAMLGSFWSRESAPPRPVPSSGIPVGEDNDGEEWQWTALTTLRNLMINDKLLPPGEIFVIETSRVFDRVEEVHRSGTDATATPSISTAATDNAYRPLGRPATRVQLKLIRNVESRFREIRFGSGMFGDHSPGRYEGGLAALERGIFEDV